MYMPHGYYRGHHIDRVPDHYIRGTLEKQPGWLLRYPEIYDAFVRRVSWPEPPDATPEDLMRELDNIASSGGG
jgi:hypothetical protein